MPDRTDWTQVKNENLAQKLSKGHWIIVLCLYDTCVVRVSHKNREYHAAQLMPIQLQMYNSSTVHSSGTSSDNDEEEDLEDSWQRRGEGGVQAGGEMDKFLPELQSSDIEKPINTGSDEWIVKLNIMGSKTLGPPCPPK